MTKSMEQKKTEFVKLMGDYGFTPNGERTYDGRVVYSRVWSKELEMVWYGSRESRLEIRVDEAYGMPNIRISRNGKYWESRGYSSPKRAINAMHEIVTFAGFEF